MVEKSKYANRHTCQIGLFITPTNKIQFRCIICNKFFNGLNGMYNYLDSTIGEPFSSEEGKKLRMAKDKLRKKLNWYKKKSVGGIITDWPVKAEEILKQNW